MKRAAMLALGLLLTPSALQANDDPRAVEAAIQRGARWLLPETRRLASQGQVRSGELALRVLALLRSGIEPGQLRQELGLLRRAPLQQTYDVSVLVLALEACSVERIPPAPGAVHPVYRPHPPDEESLAVMDRAATWLSECGIDGRWGYDAGAGRARWDHSNTQFAVYALHAASVHGAEVPPETFERIVAHHLRAMEGIALPGRADPARARELERFDEELLRAEVLLEPSSPLTVLAPVAPEPQPGGTRERGAAGAGERTRVRWSARLRGWGYTARASAPYLSMTAAGVSSVALAAERLNALVPDLYRRRYQARVVEALRDGAATVVHLQRSGHPHSGGYALLSLEKGLDCVGVEEVGGRSWWWEEARPLLEQQGPEGGWGAANGLETAFVLLFLNRGTLAPFARPDRKGPVSPRARTGSPPPPRPRTGDPSSVAATTSVLPPGAVVLPSGALAFPEQLLATARTSGGREGDRALGELKEAWEALPLVDRVSLTTPLHELGGEAARDEARSWARRELKELLEGKEAARLSTAQLLLEELSRLEDPGQREQARASLLTGLGEQALPRAVRRAILVGLVRQGERGVLPRLLDDLARREPAERRVAWDLLVALAGEPRPFEPDGPVALREKQVRAWKAWWEAERER